MLLKILLDTRILSQRIRAFLRKHYRACNLPIQCSVDFVITVESREDGVESRVSSISVAILFLAREGAH